VYYLISQFGWYLLAAFIIGLITGWLTCNRERRQWGWLPVGLLVALVALLLTWFRIINGVPALWIETALLMFALFLLGCCIGCLFKQAFSGEQPGGVREWHKDISGAAPVAAVAAVAAMPKPAPVAAAPVKPAPAPVAPKAPEPPVMPKVEGEDLIAGKRPLGLMSPRGGKADDLKLVRGIGKQNEGRLHGLGIWHFDQIAQWTRDNALWVGSYLAFPGRIEREEWVVQAKDLAAGKETAFAARVKRGEVATSKDDGSQGQSNVTSMGDDGFEGDRPKNTLSGARGGKADDLKLINGVGRAIELKLHQLGIWHFDQIAAMNDEELKFISHFSGFPGRALRENWKAESAILAKGGETDHSKAVKAGKIPSSLNDPKGKK
jgi:predicted flap endonuclease-1-like 5' DNA nuclease